MEVIWDTRASKGTVHDYHTTNNKSKKYQEPPVIYEILMDMVEVDPILFRAIDLTSSIVCYKGFDFVGDNEREIKRARKLFSTELDFDRVIKNVLRQLIIYGDSYLELVWNKNKTEIKELHPRDTQDVKMKFDKHGEIEKFVETIRGKPPTEAINYTTDEIVDFHLYQIGSSPYSKCPFKSISRSFATKIYANNYLQSIFLNLPPKLIYFLKNANEAQKEDFLQNVIRAKNSKNHQ